MDYLGLKIKDKDLVNREYLKEKLTELEKVLSEKGVK